MPFSGLSEWILHSAHRLYAVALLSSVIAGAGCRENFQDKDEDTLGKPALLWLESQVMIMQTVICLQLACNSLQNPFI